MTYPIYAMDTFFYSYAGVYPFKTRCEMAKEIGYDGIYITLMGEQEDQELESMIATATACDINIAGVYAFLNIKDEVDTTADVIRLLDRIPQDTTLELAIRDIKVDNPEHLQRDINQEDPGADLDMETLVPVLKQISEKAEAADKVVAIYPHVNFYVSHIRQAFYLCDAIKSPNLKLMFTGFHDFAICPTGMDVRIREAAPYLHQINISGVGLQGPLYDRGIDTLDVGVMDNFALLGLLKEIGFTGKIGFQGYAMGGDVYHKLEKNLQVFRAMEARLEAHPEWAVLEYGQRYWLPCSAM